MFIDAVTSTIERHRMLRPKDRVLVGVSGGPDSLALLVSLVALRRRYRFHVEAAYVDHGLRPAQVRLEISSVKKVGNLLSVPVHVVCRKVKKTSGQSLEATARSIRYEALTSLAKAKRLSILALGHTQDDQAETVLLWLLRGTGTAGLAGIPPVRKSSGGIRIIRPLIAVSRKEVEDFLRGHRIAPMRDASNRSMRFTRNRIRRELIPLLEAKYNPRLRSHLGQLAEILREDLEFLQSQWEEIFRAVGRVGKRGIRLDREHLAQYPPAARRGVLRYAVSALQSDTQGFAQPHWLSLEKMLTNGAICALDLPHRFRARRMGQRWILLSRSGRLKA